MAENGGFRAEMLDLFRSEDPAGLIRILGTPDDEYEPEVDVVIHWTRPATAEQVKALFLRMLEEGWGSLSIETAERLAEGIRRVQRDHGIAPR